MWKSEESHVTATTYGSIASAPVERQTWNIGGMITGRAEGNCLVRRFLPWYFVHRKSHMDYMEMHPVLRDKKLVIYSLRHGMALEY
jgi:hypothetical protein